ncbi:MAG TPA: carboxypeptidase regulatory-like domain-containing protein, partial [Longimicrobiales bacterium]|nr:carboxypeptidase regulatory-like domain-containing protein [Longimicrobiales bacterium]
ARHLRAGSAYGGAYGGTSLDAANVRVRPLGRLVLEAAAEDRSTARVLAGLSFAESARTARLSANLGSTWVEARYYDIGRASPWSVSERTVRSLAFRTRLAMGPVSVSPRMEWGQATDELTGGTAAFWRSGAQASLSTRSGSYGAAVEYFSEGSAYTAATPAGMNASFSASVKPFALTRVTASANATRYAGSPNFASLLGSASLERDLPFGHVAALRVSTRETMAGRGETLVMLDYTIPIRVPLGGAEETGSVHGRVYDQETGAALSKVIIEVGGRRAATDENGRFEIRGLAVGPHRVRIDRGTAGVERVPAERVPTEILVREDAPASLDIGMTLTAVLDGIVAIVRQSAAATAVAATTAASSRSSGEAEPLAGVLVELSRGGERLRRTVDERGRFTISDLRPGTWAVTVLGARLPQHYRFDRDTILVDVMPGGRAVVAFRAAAAERRVQMIAATTVSDAGVRTDATVQPARPVTTPARPEPHTVLAPEPVTPRAQPARTIVHAPARPAHEPLPLGWRLHTSPRWVSTRAAAAAAAYGDASLWPRIWLANRSLVPNPERVPAGTDLRIPPRSGLSDAESKALYEYLQRGG